MSEEASHDLSDTLNEHNSSGTRYILVFTANAVHASSWNSKHCTAILVETLPPAGIVATHIPWLSPDAWMGCILSLLVTL